MAWPDGAEYDSLRFLAPHDLGSATSARHKKALAGEGSAKSCDALKSFGQTCCSGVARPHSRAAELGDLEFGKLRSRYCHCKANENNIPEVLRFFRVLKNSGNRFIGEPAPETIATYCLPSTMYVMG